MAYHAVGWASGLDVELSIRFDGSNWDDVTADLRGFTTSITRSRALGVYPPGMGTFVLDNREGNYTPLNSSGDYYGEVLPGRHVRLKARYNSTEYDVWYGIVEDWGDRYPQAKDGIATVSAVQPSMLLAGYRGAAGSSVVGDGELSGARVDRVLTAASWPLSSTTDDGMVRVQGSDLTQDALTEISAAVLAEMGALWCERDGSLVFEDRHALVHNTRSNTSQVTFGAGGGSEVPFLVEPEPEMSSGLDLVVNSATFGNVDGTPVTLTDSASITALGATFAYSDESLIGWNQGLDYVTGNATGMLHLYADPIQHPTRISVRMAKSLSLIAPQALGRRIRDKVTVKVATPWGSTLTSPVWIVGVTHQAGRGDWLTTFEFDPADALASTGFAKWDSGVWGTSKWAY